MVSGLPGTEKDLLLFTVAEVGVFSTEMMENGYGR